MHTYELARPTHVLEGDLGVKGSPETGVLRGEKKADCGTNQDGANKYKKFGSSPSGGGKGKREKCRADRSGRHDTGAKKNGGEGNAAKGILSQKGAHREVRGKRGVGIDKSVASRKESWRGHNRR